MKTVQTKREREKRMVTEMIKLYCKKQHHTKGGALCPECDELNEYAKLRSDKCPFMETKTFCSNCKVHCYKPVMREKIRIWAIRHVVESKSEKKKLEGQT